MRAKKSRESFGGGNTSGAWGVGIERSCLHKNGSGRGTDHGCRGNRDILKKDVCGFRPGKPLELDKEGHDRRKEQKGRGFKGEGRPVTALSPVRGPRERGLGIYQKTSKKGKKM